MKLNLSGQVSNWLVTLSSKDLFWGHFQGTWVSCTLSPLQLSPQCELLQSIPVFFWCAFPNHFNYGCSSNGRPDVCPVSLSGPHPVIFTHESFSALFGCISLWLGNFFDLLIHLLCFLWGLSQELELVWWHKKILFWESQLELWRGFLCHVKLRKEDPGSGSRSPLYLLSSPKRKLGK